MKTRSIYFRNLKATLLSLSLLAAQGCARQAGKSSDANQTEIVIAAASNLSAAFDELGRRFQAQTGVHATFSFGATGDLSKQIENGAPFDVFAAADVSHVVELEQRGFLKSGSRVLYARGRVVLWMPPGSSLRIERVEDLTGERVSKIAIAKPEIAPYGQAAVEILRSLNVWAAVEPKVVYAQSVSQAKQFAATGNADAAFIPRALVKAGEGRAIEIDERLHRPIEQAIAIVRTSEKQQAAQQFITFLLSDEGQSVLASYGYDKP